MACMHGVHSLNLSFVYSMLEDLDSNLVAACMLPVAPCGTCMRHTSCFAQPCIYYI